MRKSPRNDGDDYREIGTGWKHTLAISERGRLTLTILGVCVVGVVAGLFLGGAILPFRAPEQQFVRNELESGKILNVVHADEIYTQHAHTVTTVVAVTETSPHGYTHNLVSILIPGLFAGEGPAVKGQEPNEVWVWAREYHPYSLTVPLGTKVTWINKDQEEHTVNGDNGLFGGNLPGLGSYSHTFNEPGTFTYYCEPHPAMLGTVTVK